MITFYLSYNKFCCSRGGAIIEKKYELVKQDLKEEILSGSYSINDKLPTESELMEKYDVSRYTI